MVNGELIKSTLQVSVLISLIYLVNTNFSIRLEFDPSGNENNVILYDYTDDKSASDEYISKLKTEVTQDNEEGPKTPDPTPYNLSTTTTNVQTNSTSDATTATAIATGILPVTEPPTESKTLPAHDKESTVASKAVPKTEPSNGSSQFIPLTETSTEQAPKNESLSIPEPEPVKRAEPPTKTKAPEPQSGINKKPSGLKADDKPSVPKPVDRPEPPKQTGAPKTIPIIPESSLPITTNTEKKSKDDSTSNTNSKTLKPSPSPAQDQPFSDANESGEGYEDASNQLQEQRPVSNPYSNSGKDIPEYSIGFFATVLHVITQFFRRWFHLNSE